MLKGKNIVYLPTGRLAVHFISHSDLRDITLNINDYLKRKTELVDKYLKRYLRLKKPCNPWQKHLYKSMSYSLTAGGKRIRPVLALASYEALGGQSKEILPVAASIELIHTYSLIHDDLPAMDNDDFRRNKPTNHRVFGEAVAILAGDALLTDAFGLVVSAKIKPDVLINVIRELTHACGPEGMVAGQTADIITEDKKIKDKGIVYIHTRKTGALIRASVRIGAIIAGASRGRLNALSKYGENTGLAFQIIDDVLDVVGTREELGKSAGADRASGKNTYPSVFGLEKSRVKAENLVKASLKALGKFDKKADPLREIARYIIERRN